MSDTEGKHTVVLKVDARDTDWDIGLMYETTCEVYGSMSKETAIAGAAAKVSKELRLSDPGNMEFVSYQYESPEYRVD